MTTRVQDVVDLMNSIAPPRLACKEDPVGLHAGDPAKPVRKILVALDATLAAVREAKKRKAQMLVTHHPRFYRGIRNLDESTPEGHRAAEIARAHIAVFCAHTNLDTAAGGINDLLAELTGIIDPKPLTIDARDPLLKLVVFVPEPNLEEVRDAVFATGAGACGEYSECSFRASGTGSFRGSEASNPRIGTRGVFEEVAEARLEVLLAESERAAVTAALLAAHPYEVPAYEFYQLVGSRDTGLGRFGNLKKPTTLGKLARKMKKACNAPGTLLLGNPDKPVKRVGVLGGGSLPAHKIINLGIDAFITGEMSYHETETLQDATIGLITLGHGPSESIILPRLAESLRQGLDDVTVEVLDDVCPVMRSV